MLVSQSVSGLRSELQANVVDVEGSMDELVTKAWFEEAKLRGLSGKGAGSSQKQTYCTHPEDSLEGMETNRDRYKPSLHHQHSKCPQAKENKSETDMGRRM